MDEKRKKKHITSTAGVSLGWVITSNLTDKFLFAGIDIVFARRKIFLIPQ